MVKDCGSLFDNILGVWEEIRAQRGGEGERRVTEWKVEERERIDQ